MSNVFDLNQVMFSLGNAIGLAALETCRRKCSPANNRCSRHLAMLPLVERIGVPHSPVIIQVAVITKYTVAGTQLQLIDKLQNIDTLEERFFGDSPSSRYGGEEAPLVSLGKLAGTVVTELCFQQVAVGKRVIRYGLCDIKASLACS